jgi:hypothetical protein
MNNVRNYKKNIFKNRFDFKKNFKPYSDKILLYCSLLKDEI